MKIDLQFWKRHTHAQPVMLIALVFTGLCQVLIIQLLISNQTLSSSGVILRGAIMTILPAIAGFFSSRIAAFSINKFQRKLVAVLSREATNNIEQLHPETYSKAALVEVDRLFDFWRELFLNIFFNIPVLIYMQVILVIKIDTKLSAGVLAVFIFLLWSAYKFNYFIKTYHMKHHSTYLGLLNRIRNYVENVLQFRMYSRQEEYLDELTETLNGFSKLTARLSQFRQLYNAYINALLVLFVWAGLWIVKRNFSFSAGSIAVVMLVFLEIRRIAAALFRNIASYQRASESAAILNQWILSDDKEPPTLQRPVPFKNVVVDNFEFRYHDRQQSISYPAMSINSGERIWIKGYNGRGKSTLWKVLTGLYSNPDSANSGIFKGSAATGLGPVWENTAAVPEPARCFDGKLWEIIGNYASTKNEVVEWLTKRQLLTFFESYPFQLETFYDSALKNLSAGQLKWLLIVQAFFATPDLLILDEPFSSLDTDRQEVTLRLIRELPVSVTLIVVTHQAMPVTFDKIITLN